MHFCKPKLINYLLVMKHSFALLVIFAFLNYNSFAQRTLSEYTLKDAPKGTKIILLKDVKIPADRTSMTLYFLDDHVSFGEIHVNPSDSTFYIPKGYEMIVDRTYELAIKDYYGYKTKLYVYFSNDTITRFLLIAADDIEFTLNDINDSDVTDHYYKVELPQELIESKN